MRDWKEGYWRSIYFSLPPASPYTPAGLKAQIYVNKNTFQRLVISRSSDVSPLLLARLFELKSESFFFNFFRYV